MKIYTSDDIEKKDDLYDLQEMGSSGIPIKYQMTKGEIEWYRFILGKYSIADFIDDNTTGDFLLTIDDENGMSRALDDDCNGFGKAVMLSDDSALQKIFFWLYQEEN